MFLVRFYLKRSVVSLQLPRISLWERRPTMQINELLNVLISLIVGTSSDVPFQLNLDQRTVVALVIVLLIMKVIS